MHLPEALRTLRHRVIQAKSNGIDYDVWTWAPPGYGRGTEPLPLLVVLDATWFMGTAVEAAYTQSMLRETHPILLVGVSAAAPRLHAAQRLIDYSSEVPSLDVPEGAEISIWESSRKLLEAVGIPYEEGFGGTDAFHGFLADQLLPELREQLRVDVEQIGIAGHSSGGEFSVDTLLREPTPFTRFIVGSYGTDVFAKRLSEREAAFGQREGSGVAEVFCGYGGGELEDPDMRPYVQSGIDFLERLGRHNPERLKLTLRNFERETHGSVFHHVLSSGIRELWGTGLHMAEAFD